MRYLIVLSVLAMACGDDSAGDAGPDSSFDAADATDDVGTDDAVVPDAGTPGLTSWVPCGDDRGECATLTVPVDYDDPSVGTMRLALHRLPALGERIGVLLFAAGSGGSGTYHVEHLPGRVTPGMGEIFRRFDVIGLDLRGNGMSEPTLSCFATPEALSAAVQSIVEAPDDDAVQSAAGAIVQGCRERVGLDLGYFSTAYRVRDIDFLRETLGEEQLSLLGESYGTWTEAAYAIRFPTRVRAAVLASALPIAGVFERAESSARGGDAALTGFFDWCDATESCAFKPPSGTTRARFEVLAASLDPELHARLGSVVIGWLWFNSGTPASEGYFELAETLEMFESTPVLPEPSIGPASVKGFLEQMLDLDSGDESLASWRARVSTLRSELGTGGQFVSERDLRIVLSISWTQPRVTVPIVAIPEVPPFLFLAGDLDPITPVEGANALATALGNDSVVLDTQIVGHNVLFRAPCAQRHATEYLLDPASLVGSPPMDACPEVGADETVIGTVSAVFEWDGESDSRLNETAIGNLVTDAMRADAESQLAIINGGGMRTALPSASVLPTDTALRRPEAGYAAGPPFDVVVDDVRSVLPFGNRSSTITLTGAQLWTFLEATLASYDGTGAGNQLMQVSGFSYAFDAEGPTGARVTGVTLSGGDAIANDASTTYSLTMPDFVYFGGTGYLGFVELTATHGRSLDEALVDYLIANSRDAATDLDPVIEGRIEIN